MRFKPGTVIIINDIQINKMVLGYIQGATDTDGYKVYKVRWIDMFGEIEMEEDELLGLEPVVACL